MNDMRKNIELLRQQINEYDLLSALCVDDAARAGFKSFANENRRLLQEAEAMLLGNR